MIDLSFSSEIDHFEFSSGKKAILLTSPHAFINEKQLKEYKKYHLADFIVSPFIREIRQLSNDYYIIENKIPRDSVDMNRLEARKNDDIDENDFIFRQAIRFALRIIKYKHDKKPILIDIHSYPEDSEVWGKYDLMILEQTKKGMKTNKSLLDFTEKHFESKGYTVATTDQHNQDDIVEEIALKGLAIPILIEINEKYINNDKFDTLIKDFDEYFTIIDKKNEKHFKSLQEDSIPNSLGIDISQYPSSLLISKITDELDKSNKITNIEIRTLYQKYLNLLNEYILLNESPSTFLSENTDYKKGYEDLSELHSSIDDFANRGHNDQKIIENTIITLSNQYDSTIIPIELFVKNLKMIYATINRETFQEWGIDESALITSPLGLISNPKAMKKFDMIIPLFKENPYEKLTIFKSYKMADNNYSFFIFYHGAIKKISKDSYQKDLQYFEESLKLPIEIMNKLKKGKVSNLRNFLKNNVL